MCGITITSCSKNINLSTRIKPEEINLLINSIIKTKKNQYVDKLFELVMNYKSDLNFLNYFKSKRERNEIYLCKKKLQKFVNKNKKINNILLSRNEKILDILWFLDYELINRFKFVKSFIGKTKYLNHSLIFFKTLNSVINSINLLEIRGRDSLGLMFSINLKNTTENISWVKKNLKLEKYIKVNKKNIIVNVIYKNCNIFGSLGDNSKIILKKIKNDHKILKLLKSGIYENINIIAHTRWASVGQVDMDNTHPLVNVTESSNKIPTIFSVMNGDIYNYINVISKSKKIKNIHYNHNKKSDTLALSYLFAENSIFNNKKKLKRKLSKIEGSFVGAVISDEEISKILIIKKGNLGLYYGKNNDREFFSSDIYGLVEECKYFYEFKKNTFSILNKQKNLNLIKKNQKLKKINITTRDVSKKNYSYYLEKEINEAPEIINKTISNYINITNVLSKKNNFFVNKEFSKLHPIIKKIKNKKIDKIIITGMGTCHTAAEGIAHYMRENLYPHLSHVSILAEIASEASAFQMERNMEKTLIIAIAQSGTTKDTNTFVEMAKSRGANVIAFLNKRNGDISYIADSTLYLGNGRDIEIAVPSTKTYLCHLILGYIFTLNIISKTLSDPKKISKRLKEILKVSEIISLILKKNKVKNRNTIYKKFSKNKNWYCLYDDHSKKYASMEIRIKLSECCYKTLPYMDVGNFIKNGIKDSVLVYDTGFESSQLENTVKELIKKNNFIVLIGSEENLKKICKRSKYVYKLVYPKILKDYSIIFSVLYGQMLSFNVAKFLDKRGNFFNKLAKDLIRAKKSKTTKNFLLNKYDDDFLVNYPKNEILTLKQNIKNFFLNKNKKVTNVIKHINYLEQYSRRPIDTIKHQAKTITVGTERKKIFNNNFKINNMKKNNFANFNFKKNSVRKFINKIKKRLKFNNNLKFIGGDINFKAAQYLANKVCKSLNVSCAFDVLENHKHIDMSAEPNLIVLIANISESNYLSDTYAEIDKFISHNNFPFIVTNNAENKYFKKLKKSQVIQIPFIKKEQNLIFYLKFFEKLYKQ